MSENNPFSSYEYVGVVAPGIVLVAAAAHLIPSSPIKIDGTTSLGSLGVLLIISFVAGHLVQALGNAIEVVVWRPWGGMPSTWPLTGRRAIISTDQSSAVFRRIDAMREDAAHSWPTDARTAYFIGREIYALLDAAERTERLEMFNRTYGLLRGISAAFLVTAVFSAFVAKYDYALVLLACSIIAGYRMYRFGIIYGRELYVQFLALDRSTAQHTK